MKLSVVVPAMNEEENLPETLEGISKSLDISDVEILVVNDHSTDGTSAVVRKMLDRLSCMRLVDNLKEPGFANALRTGFEESRGKYVVPFMADRCDDPSSLPLMLEKCEQGYDLVCGSRYVRGGRRIGGPLLQGCFSRIVGITLHMLSGIPTRDAGNAFKMYRRDILLSFTLSQKGFAVSMEACVKFFLNGFRICDIPTSWYGRKKGKSKFRLSRTMPYVKLYFYTIWKKWTSRL